MRYTNPRLYFLLYQTVQIPGSGMDVVPRTAHFLVYSVSDHRALHHRR